MCSEGLNKLQVAVVGRAVKDYQKALKEDDAKAIEKLQHYFLEDPFVNMICDGEQLIQKLGQNFVMYGTCVPGVDEEA